MYRVFRFLSHGLQGVHLPAKQRSAKREVSSKSIIYCFLLELKLMLQLHLCNAFYHTSFIFLFPLCSDHS